VGVGPERTFSSAVMVDSSVDTGDFPDYLESIGVPNGTICSMEKGSVTLQGTPVREIMSLDYTDLSVEYSRTLSQMDYAAHLSMKMDGLVGIPPKGTFYVALEVKTNDLGMFHIPEQASRLAEHEQLQVLLWTASRVTSTLADIDYIASSDWKKRFRKEIFGYGVPTVDFSRLSSRNLENSLYNLVESGKVKRMTELLEKELLVDDDKNFHLGYLSPLWWGNHTEGYETPDQVYIPPGILGPTRTSTGKTSVTRGIRVKMKKRR